MKHLFLFLVLATCSIADAEETMQKHAPDVSTLRPEYASTKPASTDCLESYRELKELIRAQTDAIRTLSNKIDVLDGQLRRIESKVH